MLLVAAFVLGASPISHSAETYSEELDRIILRLFATGALHGGILVAEHDEIVYERAIGVADFDSGTALGIDQRFTVNSQGKMFTAVLVMQLVEEGRVSLDQSLDTLLPAYQHPRAAEITLHDLLSHRSGLPDYFLRIVLEGREGATEASADEMLEIVRGMPLEFDPGTKFHYSNTGYLLLAKIIEAKRETTFGEVLQRRLFDPLGRSESVPADRLNPEEGPDYLSQDGRIIRDVPTDYVGDGGAKSTLQDMHRFMSALGSAEVLEPESWELMFAPHSLPSEVPEGAWPPPHMNPYGYGFSIMQLPYSETEEAIAVGHGGAGFGSSSMAIRYLESGRIVINYNTISKNPILMDVLLYLAGRGDGD